MAIRKLVPAGLGVHASRMTVKFGEIILSSRPVGSSVGRRAKQNTGKL